MSKKDNKDYIYLIWKDPKSRRNFIIGELSRNDQYEFKYGFEVEEAIENGFELLIPFVDLDKVYKSDTLFSAFSSRLPDRKRRGIENILKKYNMSEFDEYELLKKSGARLPIDNLEFIDPLKDDGSSEIERKFHIAGSRYYLNC